MVTRIIHYVLLSTDVLFSDDLLIMGKSKYYYIDNMSVVWFMYYTYLLHVPISCHRFTCTCSVLTLPVGNECLCQLSACLQSHFANFCPELIQYILHQFDFQELPSNELALSLVKLVLQVKLTRYTKGPNMRLFYRWLKIYRVPYLLNFYNNFCRVIHHFCLYDLTTMLGYKI